MKFYVLRRLPSGWWETRRNIRRRGAWRGTRVGVTPTVERALRVAIREGEE